MTESRSLEAEIFFFTLFKLYAIRYFLFIAAAGFSEHISKQQLKLFFAYNLDKHIAVMEVRHHKSLTRRQMSNSGVSPTIINDMMTTDPNETINSLLLKKMDSMRTANIILEVFSLLAVLGIVTRILYDAKKTNNLKVSLHPR